MLLWGFVFLVYQFSIRAEPKTERSSTITWIHIRFIDGSGITGVAIIDDLRPASRVPVIIKDHGNVENIVHLEIPFVFG